MRRTTSHPLSRRPVASLSLGAAAALFVVAATACGVESAPEGTAPRDAEIPLQSPPATMRVPAPLPAAHCEVTVTGVGTIDLETEYLPNVVQCENGGANLEALKAQAIAARSVAYYNMETEGEICDSQGCQVYSCGGEPNALQIQAVEETSGIYLMYNSTLTYGFYVAGDNNPAPPACEGVSGATEHWVTYNSGQSGTDVEQTELGFVHPNGDPSYGQNRGCMSQWGARCLENDTGADYLDILRFYYGEDIELVQAEGECVTPQETTTTDGTSSTDDTSAEATAADDTSSDPSGDAETGITPPDSTTTDDPSDDDTSGGNVSGGTAGPSDDDGTDPSAGAGSGGAPTEALPDGFGEDDDGGCGCRAPSDRGGSGWMVLGLLGLLRLRSRRRR